MWNLTLTNNEQTIDEVWEWYLGVTEDLGECRARALKALREGDIYSIPKRLWGKKEEETIKHYEEMQKDLDLITSFALFASFEAALKVDLVKRAQTANTDAVTVHFKAFFGNLKKEPSLKALIQEWATHCCYTEFDGFDNVRYYRNWLAHGRYDTPEKDSMKYSDPTLVKKLIDGLKACMECAITNNASNMHWKR